MQLLSAFLQTFKVYRESTNQSIKSHLKSFFSLQVFFTFYFFFWSNKKWSTVVVTVKAQLCCHNFCKKLKVLNKYTWDENDDDDGAEEEKRRLHFVT